MIESVVNSEPSAEPAGSVTHTCTVCEKPLEPLFDENTAYQFDNALWVGFFGGYSMFVDEIGEGDDRLPGAPYAAAVLCHECAHDLCDQHPWISALVKPQTSHAHSYRKDWTGHTGWDLPHSQD